MVYGAIIGAVLPARRRRPTPGSNSWTRTGSGKPAWPLLFCLAAFYLFDLYDFVVMHDRRELVLRLVQALGLAWIALGLCFYVYPDLMLGRGIFSDRVAARTRIDGGLASFDSLVFGPPGFWRADLDRRFGQSRRRSRA